MKITNKEMTELEKISYDIASYVTHEHNKHDIRSLREFIENRIQESELNKTNDIHNVSHSYYQVVFDGVNDDMQEVTAGLKTLEEAKQALEDNKKHFDEPMYIIARINCG